MGYPEKENPEPGKVSAVYEMKILIRTLYNLNRLALLLLALAFLSFYLVTFPGLKDGVTPAVEYATRYLPALLVPVAVLMLVLLIFRYFAKKENEEIGIGDILAGILAVAGQIGVIALYRAQGNEVLNSSLLMNIPNVSTFAEKAAPLGILGVAALQMVTFVLYWVADPDKKPRAGKGRAKK